MESIYLIGALKNKNIPKVANELEAEGFEVFDSWFSPGELADICWKEYENARGRTYAEALKGYAGTHIFEFDKFHLDRCDIGVLVMPSGKSACMELGYLIGCGKPGFILFDKEPEKWDVMLKFATAICFSMEELKIELAKLKNKNTYKVKEKNSIIKNIWIWIKNILSYI